MFNLEIRTMKPSYRKVRTAINGMVGDMSIDRETALAKLAKVIRYAEQLYDTLSDDDDDGPDTLPFDRRAA